MARSRSSVTQSSFLANVGQHQMSVLREEGLYRHLRFRKPVSGDQYFDLITWPGSLCFTGDMGTYVSSRLDDMFEFFRADRPSAPREGLSINPGYWSEKLQSIDRADGFKVFDMEQFKAAVRDEVASFLKDCGWPRERRRMLLDEVKQRILQAADEYEAVQGMREFRFDGAPGLFTDFFSQDLERYSDRFLWCCYAVAWGVQKYDRARQRVDRPVPAEPQEQRPRERA